jgi:hypothetical protein
MTPRDRVVAALRKGPGDRIPYVGRFFHPKVATDIERGLRYLLDPRTPELGFAGDGALKARADLDRMKFRPIGGRFLHPRSRS